MLTYSMTPPIGAPRRIQPNRSSGTLWSRNEMLKIRLAKKIGENVSRLATTKRRALESTDRRLRRGNTSVARHDTISRENARGTDQPARNHTAHQFAASTMTRTATNTSEVFTHVVPNSRLN